MRMIPPEIRFVQRVRPGPASLPRNPPVTRLSASHHIAEPIKTPETTSIPPPDIVVAPRPAKMAANDKIVMGLVKVSKNVEP
jgi:hypothetical protein